MYTLEEVITKSTHIAPKRKTPVKNWLKTHNIISWDDLLAWHPNYTMTENGLSSNEVWVLYKIREKEDHIRYRKNLAKFELIDSLRLFSSKHESTRISNILFAHDIISKQLLRSTSTDKLKSFDGIGPKSIDILEKVKRCKTAEEIKPKERLL